jgi:hypothetical protein
MSIRSVVRRTRGPRAEVARAVAVGCAATLAAAAAGCVTAGAGTGGDTPPPVRRLLAGTTADFRREHVAPSRSTLRVIGTDLLAPEPDRPVYDLVLRTWPRVLRPDAGPAAALQDPRGDVVGVYARGAFLGGQDVLRTVPARQVLALYRLTAAEEYSRFGRSHPGGAIEVVWAPGMR